MIKVYSTATCPYCHALMDWLDDLGVEYEEVDATDMPGIEVVPVTEIDGKRIEGFDRPAIKKALKKLQDKQFICNFSFRLLLDRFPQNV